jgi:hypothetical protein
MKVFINFIKVLVLGLSLNIFFYSVSLAHHLSDEDYGSLVKSILIKNQIINNEKSVSNILVKKNVASLASAISNLNNTTLETHNRIVSFRLDLSDTMNEVRVYKCNLSLKIINNTTFEAARLSSCEFTGYQNTMWTL